MPIYEYQCQACGHRMEAIQRLSDKPFTKCPECEGALKKLISSPAFQFKGTGWYVTDYAGKKDGGSSKGEDSGGSSDGGSSESKAKSGDKKSSGGESGGSAASTGTSKD